jgi:hypothetical protein
MKIRIIAVLLMAGTAIVMAGCEKSEKNDNNTGLALLAVMASSSGDTIAEMSQASLDTVNDSLADINTSGQASLSYNVPYPATWRANPTIDERILMAEGNMMEPFSAKAATTTCPGGGSVEVTDAATTWNSDNSSFIVTRTFNDCTGPFGFFKVGGSGLLSWSGLNGAGVYGVSKLKSSTQVQQAPVNKRFTRVLTGGYITVEGNGGAITDGTLSGKVAHTVIWSSVSPKTFTIATDLTRKGYNGQGTNLYEHHITTPSPLNVTADTTAGTRTVSGSVKVEHVRTGAIVTTTFSSLVISMNNCSPTSGQATVAISGYWDGSGTITYTGNGLANYTYSYSNERGRTVAGQGSFVVSGCQ